jgi:hypothetical protein
MPVDRKSKAGAAAAALPLIAGGVKPGPEKLVTVPGRGHPPIRHVRTRSLLDELDWRLDMGPGLTAAAERKFLDAIRDARRELTVDVLDYRVVRP